MLSNHAQRIEPFATGKSSYQRFIISTHIPLACLALFLVLMSSGTLKAQLIPNEGLIAFNSYTEYDCIKDPSGICIEYPLDSEITIIDLTRPIGFRHVAVAQAAINKRVRHALNPKFSHDGRWLVFAGIPQSEAADSDWPNHLDIWLLDLKTSNVRNLSKWLPWALNKPDEPNGLVGWTEEDPCFHPKEYKIVFKQRFYKPGIGHTYELWELSLWNEGNIDDIDPADIHNKSIIDSYRQLTYSQLTEESGPIFSLPNGDYIYYWEDAGATAKIRKINMSSLSIDTVVDCQQIEDHFPAPIQSDKLVYSRWTSNTVSNDQVVVFDEGKPTNCPSNLSVNILPSDNPFKAPFIDINNDDSDPFLVAAKSVIATGPLIGFSSTRPLGKGGYDIYIGALEYSPSYTGPTQILLPESTTKQDVGGSYTPYNVPREVAMVNEDCRVPAGKIVESFEIFFDTDVGGLLIPGNKNPDDFINAFNRSNIPLNPPQYFEHTPPKLMGVKNEIIQFTSDSMNTLSGPIPAHFGFKAKEGLPLWKKKCWVVKDTNEHIEVAAIQAGYWYEPIEQTLTIEIKNPMEKDIIVTNAGYKIDSERLELRDLNREHSHPDTFDPLPVLNGRYIPGETARHIFPEEVPPHTFARFYASISFADEAGGKDVAITGEWIQVAVAGLQTENVGQQDNYNRNAGSQWIWIIPVALALFLIYYFILRKKG